MMAVLLTLSLYGLSVALLLRRSPYSVGVLFGLVLASSAGLLYLVNGTPWGPVNLLLLGAIAAFSPPRLRGRRTLPARRRPSRSRPTSRAATKTPPEVSGLEDKYELLERIGIGGMASVYRARRKIDGRVVALKIPQEKFVGDPRFVRRFHREAEVLQRLEHPNIVKVFDHGASGETHYIAMEYLDGEGLDRLIEDRRLSMRVAIQIMRRVADALRHIHQHGIIHRDIKPGNIMVLRGAIRDDGTLDPAGVRLMDFGIAAGKVLTRLTITGARIGTPVYMSPEQAKGQRIDHRSDIYSLGIVFYEVLTGQAPFQGGYESVVHQQIFQVPTPPQQLNPEIPKSINDLIMRMLAKDPDKRPSLDEVIQELERPPQEARGLSAAWYLAIAAEAKRGSIRLVELDGTPARLFSGVGTGEGMFASPPLDIATDPDGNVWVTVFEYGSHNTRMVHRFSPEGRITLSLGPYGMKLGEFVYPVALTVSPSGDLFVLDGETHMIHRFELNGQPVARFGGKGTGRGVFDTPRQIVAGRHFLYVLDYGNRQVQRLSLEGQYLSRYAFRKSKDSNELRLLGGIGIDDAGHVYIFDADAQKIRKITHEGKVVGGYALPLGEGEDPRSLVDIVVDANGIVYAARRGAQVVRRFAPDGTPLPELPVYAAIRGLALWRNPKPEPAASPQHQRP